VDVDILKPDTGLVTLQRPHYNQNSPSYVASARSSTLGNSSGVMTPDDPELGVLGYTEPISEGEEEEENAVLAPARDEGAATRLSTQDAAEAIAFRENMLRERASSSVPSSVRKALKALKALGGGSNAEVDTGASVSSTHAGRSGALGRRALAIDPLAPASTFDEVFRDKLTRGEGAKGAPTNGYGPREDEAADDGRYSDEDETEAIRALEQRTGDERILVRDWRAPAGKRIAVPIRIEPKVYFATERTFLVRLFWLGLGLGG
jgi:hypothetical protein